MTGTIKFFSKAKGYGFIAGDDGKDAFLHISKVEGFDGVNYPVKGQRVEYQPTETNRGIQARFVLLDQ